MCVAGEVCMVGEHAWQEACMAGGMHGGGEGLAYVAGRHAWQGACVAREACMARRCAWQTPRDTVNDRAVRILLECILVDSLCDFERDC